MDHIVYCTYLIISKIHVQCRSLEFGGSSPCISMYIYNVIWTYLLLLFKHRYMYIAAISIEYVYQIPFPLKFSCLFFVLFFFGGGGFFSFCFFINFAKYLPKVWNTRKKMENIWIYAPVTVSSWCSWNKTLPPGNVHLQMQHFLTHIQ